MLPVAPGEKILQRCVCFRWNSAALKGAEVRGHGARGTIKAAAGPSDGDENMCRNITINHFNDGSSSVALLVFVMLQTQFDPSIVLSGPSHFHTRDHAPVCGPASKLLLLFLHLSHFSSCFLSFDPNVVSAPHSILPSNLLSFPLFSLLAIGGTQPNVKRGNLTASLASAAFTPTVCTTQKVK